ASEALDRERFEAGASSESGTREPRGAFGNGWCLSRKATGELKNVQAVRAAYFYEACPSAIRADATGVERQRGIRVSARIRNSGVLWGMSLPRSHPRPCHQAV